MTKVCGRTIPAATRRRRGLAGLCLALAASAAIPQARAQTQDSAVLHAQFKLENGYFVIDEARSTFEDSARGKFGAVPDAKAAIVEIINRSLRKEIEAIFYSMGRGEIEELWKSRNIDNDDADHGVDDGMLRASEAARRENPDLVNITSSWSDLAVNRSDRFEFLKESFRRFLSEPRGMCWAGRDTPVLYIVSDPVDTDPEDLESTLNHGTLVIPIADPIEGRLDESIVLGRSEAERAAFARAGITPRKIAQLTASLKGKLWSRTSFERQIGDYLVRAGISGARIERRTTDDCPFSGPERRIEILGAPARLRKIVITKSRDERAAAEMLLSRVLPHRDFRYFRAHPELLESGERTIVDGQAEPVWTFDLGARQGRRLPESGPYGYLVTDRKFDDLGARITILGYRASTLSGTANAPQTEGFEPVPQANGVVPSVDEVDPWLELVVVPLEASGGSDRSAPPEPGPADGANPGPANPATVNPPAPPAIPSATTAATAAAKPAVTGEVGSRLRNHIRGTAGKQPGKPFLAGVEYLRDGLTGNDDSLALTISNQGKPSFTGSYTRDFASFDALGGRRLSLSVSGQSAYLPDHAIDGATVDERRTGGSVAAQLELFRDWRGHWLNLDASFSYDELDQQDQSTQATTESWLWRGRIGFGYRWLKDLEPDFPRIAINPAIDIGRSSGRGVYFKPAADARIHGYLPGFFEFDSHFAAAWSSPHTPGTELPRFGGSESVRGFKDEIAAARSTWAIQSEVHVPIRFLGRIAPGIDEFVRRNLKFAGFVDVGGTGRNSEGLSGFEAGAGLGLRLSLQDRFQMRLDWAHPLTGSTRRQRGALYFSIVILPEHF